VSIVYKEVKGVEHVSVILQDWHLQGGLHDLFKFGICLFSVMNEFNALLLVLLSQQIRSLFDESFASL
jgi:hypothetical protein